MRWRRLAIIASVGLLIWMLVTAAVFVRVQNRLSSPTVSLRLTSSGTVAWDSQVVPLTSMPGELERTVEVFRSHGMWPIAEIEVHDNASPDDVRRLTELAEEAGFKDVRVKQRALPDAPEK